MEKNKNKALEVLKEGFMQIAGCVLFATAVNAFAVPNSIAQSGITGIAVVLNRLFSLPLGVSVILLNVPLLILARIFLGKKLMIKTLWVALVLSVSLDLIGKIVPAYTGDKILTSLFCGLLQGAGLGLIALAGATSGGTDIIARLIHKYRPHITIGKAVLVADAFIIAAGMFVFKSVESGLYAVIVIFVSSRVIDSMVYGAGVGKLLMVVTEKADEVSKAILTASRRGVSIIPAVGAYTGKNKNVLLCVARKNEISGIIKIIKSIDDKTFIIIAEANEILGEGFKRAT